MAKRNQNGKKIRRSFSLSVHHEKPNFKVKMITRIKIVQLAVIIPIITFRFIVINLVQTMQIRRQLHLLRQQDYNPNSRIQTNPTSNQQAKLVLGSLIFLIVYRCLRGSAKRNNFLSNIQLIFQLCIYRCRQPFSVHYPVAHH